MYNYRDNRKLIKLLLITSIIFLVVAFSGAFSNSVVASGWQTLETDHFYVHYLSELEDEAFKSAEIAEEVHEELIEYYQYERQDKTHLIVKDDSDRAAGVTTPYLLDSIKINLSHPLRREFGSSFAEWLKVLIAHEYAHVLHLNLRAGGSEAIRRIFGRVPTYTYPNMFQPYWMLEGYAIMAESMLTEGGRADNSVYDMYMRISFIEETLHNFDQIHGQYNLETWPPGGQSVYIYGASIFDHLVAEYGKDKLIEVSEIYSQNPGRGINSSFQEVYDQDVFQLYENWLQEMEQKYRREVENLSQEGLTAGYSLTDVGHQVYQPTLSPDGEYIIYYHTGNKFPGLRKFNLETERDSTLKTGIMAPTGHSFTPEGNLVFAQLNQYDHESDYYDLYKYNFSEEQVTGLTEGARAHSPVVTSENEVIYITREAGNTRIVSRKNLLANNDSIYTESNKEKSEEKILLEGEEGEQFLHLSLAPSGEKLAFVSWQQGGYQDLHIYDLNDQTRRRITSGKETVISPSWKETGEEIIFSADYEGIYNIYSYNIAEEEITQLTRELGGAFDPLIKKNTEIDGREKSSLIYVGYSSTGYNLYQMPAAEALNNPQEALQADADEYNGPAGLSLQDNADDQELNRENISRDDVRDYSLSEYILPRYFVPSLFLGTGGGYAGVTFGGRDPLDIVHYQSTLEYDGWDFTYPFSYDWNLQLDLGKVDVLQQSSRQAGRQMRNTDFYYQDVHNLQLLYPLWQDIFSQLRIGAGAGYQRRNIREGGIDELYQVYGLGEYLKQGGRDEIVNTRNISLNLGSIYFARDQYIFSQLDWREFWEITGSHSLSLRGSLAWTDLEAGFEMGSLFGEYPVRGYRERVRGSQLYYLRGEYRYPFWKIKRGLGISPVFFDQVSGALFAEGGEISTENEEEILLGFGGELTLDLELSYGRMPAQLNIGLAGNIDEPGMRFYISPGLTF